MRIETPGMEGRRLFVSFKLSEVCNLACPYCYFFFMDDDSYQSAKPFMSNETAEDVARFLAQGARDLDIKTIEIALHGGEPTMAGKERFDDYCTILRRIIPEHTKLNLGMQTNGILLDREWIELCQKHRVGIGISIDGPPDVHNAVRITKKGRGTYDETVAAIRLLQDYEKEEGVSTGLGALAVVNPDSSAPEVYQHLCHDLGLKALDFRLPILSWDEYTSEMGEKFKTFYVELLNCWLEDDDPTINIRTLKHYLAPFLTDFGLECRTNYMIDLVEAICIRSDGDVCPDDSIPPVSKQFRYTGYNVKDTTLAAFYEAPFWKDIRDAVLNPPQKCRDCTWFGYCGGGHIASRYSSKNGFNNPTVYCDIQKEMYGRVREYILQYLDADLVDGRTARSRAAIGRRVEAAA